MTAVPLANAITNDLLFEPILSKSKLKPIIAFAPSYSAS